MFLAESFFVPQIHSDPPTCLGTHLYLQLLAAVTELAVKYLLLGYLSSPEEQREIVKAMSREIDDLRVDFWRCRKQTLCWSS